LPRGEPGAEAIKIFSVNAPGEVFCLKAVKAVFPRCEFVSTSGVNLESAMEYIKAGVRVVGPGGELTKESESVMTEETRSPQGKIEHHSN